VGVILNLYHSLCMFVHFNTIPQELSTKCNVCRFYDNNKYFEFGRLSFVHSSTFGLTMDIILTDSDNVHLVCEALTTEEFSEHLHCFMV